MFVQQSCRRVGCGVAGWLSRAGRRLSSAAESSVPLEPKQQSPGGELGETKKSSRSPFLKNAFAGRFDGDLLVYPEVVDLEELREKVARNCGSGAAPAENLSVPERVKYLFNSNVPLMSGPDWGDSERAKSYELHNPDLQTALLMDTQTLVIEAIAKFGTSRLKSKYLSGLLSGDLTGAVALTETCTGSDPTSLSATAELDPATGAYVLNGTKLWVTNGQRADVFVVFATTDPQHGRKFRNLAAFLVDRKTAGLSQVEQASYELPDSGICTIRFNNCPVPSDHVLGDLENGFGVARLGVTHNRYFSLTALLGAMKSTLAQVHSSVITRRQFPLPLKDRELVQYKLSQIGCWIYSLESMLYLYTGLSDQHEMDLSTESASLQSFAYTAALKTMSLCNELLGGASYDRESPFMRQAAQVKGLILASKTQTLLRLFVAMTGMQHAGMMLTEEVTMGRHPLNYPGFALRRIISMSRQQRDSPRMELCLFENIHPSLKPAAEVLEYAVLRLKYAVEVLFNRYGNDTVNKQIDLVRLADVATDIFAMTAVLGRASRSYCTGIRHADHELQLAHAVCLAAFLRVKHNFKQVIEGGVVSNDVGHLKIAAEILNAGGYVAEHPLVRNIK